MSNQDLKQASATIWTSVHLTPSLNVLATVCGALGRWQTLYVGDWAQQGCTPEGSVGGPSPSLFACWLRALPSISWVHHRSPWPQFQRRCQPNMTQSLNQRKPFFHNVCFYLKVFLHAPPHPTPPVSLVAEQSSKKDVLHNWHSVMSSMRPGHHVYAGYYGHCPWALGEERDVFHFQQGRLIMSPPAETTPHCKEMSKSKSRLFNVSIKGHCGNGP